MKGVVGLWQQRRGLHQLQTVEHRGRLVGRSRRDAMRCSLSSRADPSGLRQATAGVKLVFLCGPGRRVEIEHHWDRSRSNRHGSRCISFQWSEAHERESQIVRLWRCCRCAWHANNSVQRKHERTQKAVMGVERPTSGVDEGMAAFSTSLNVVERGCRRYRKL